jgi:hypothetical protein
MDVTPAARTESGPAPAPARSELRRAKEAGPDERKADLKVRLYE